MSLRTKTYLLFIGSLNIGFAALTSGIGFLSSYDKIGYQIVSSSILGFLILTSLCFWFSDFRDKSAAFLPDPSVPLKKWPLFGATAMLLAFPLAFNLPEFNLQNYLLIFGLTTLSVTPFTLFCFWTRRLAATLPPEDPQVDWNAELKESSPVL